MTGTQFTTSLNNVLNRFSRDEIKTAIGDSTNNNRTVTVSQVVRFLSNSNSTNYKALGRRLNSVHDLVRNGLAMRRMFQTSRTDAHDIMELLEEIELVSARDLTKAVSI